MIISAHEMIFSVCEMIISAYEKIFSAFEMIISLTNTMVKIGRRYNLIRINS
jgi:hypothetical protein